MKYELKEFNRNIPDLELLDDLKKVASELGKDNLSAREYDQVGKFTSGTIGVRFGSWNKALKKADLKLTQVNNPSDIELFKNLEKVWAKLGGQPVQRDIKRPLSEYGSHCYMSKFGTWRNALQAFIAYINSDNEQEQIIEEENNNTTVVNETEIKHKTKLDVGNRLKVQVLMRDIKENGHIECALCQIPLSGADIHYDHITAWSKGGETVLENIQILCKPHNLAKGNI